MIDARRDEAEKKKGGMRTEFELRMMLICHQESLRGWDERGGWLLPTEPDELERSKIRERLRASIGTLLFVLGEQAPLFLPKNTERMHGATCPHCGRSPRGEAQ